MARGIEVVDVPVTGGVDEHTSRRKLAGRLRRLENGRYARAGEIVHRNGTLNVAPYSLRPDGATPPAPEALIAHRSELVRLGRGELDAFVATPTGANWNWAPRGRASEMVVERENFASAPGEGLVAVDVAYAGGYVMYLYTVFTGGIASDRLGEVYADLIHLESGTTIFAQKLIASDVVSSGDFPWASRVEGGVSGDPLFVVAWRTDVAIIAQTFNAGTMAWTSPVTLGSSFVNVPASLFFGVNGYFDMKLDPAASTLFVVAELAAGATRLSISTWVPATLASAGFVTTGSTTATGFTGFTVEAQAASIMVGYTFTSAGTYHVEAQGFNATLATLFSPVTVESALSDDQAQAVSAKALSASSYLLVWNRVYAGGAGTGTGVDVRWNKIDTAGTLSFSPARYASGLQFCSRPWLVQGRGYVAVVNASDQNMNAFDTARGNGGISSIFAVDLHTDDDTLVAPKPRFAAMLCPRQTRAVGLTASSVAVPDGVLTVGLVGGYSLIRRQGTAMRMTYTTPKRSSSSLPQNLVVGGGFLASSGAAKTVELGFAYQGAKPEDLVPSFTGTASVHYCTTWTWYDQAGNRHDSTPSDVGTVLVPLPGAFLPITGTLTCLHLTNKQTTAGSDKVLISLWRTERNGTVFYLVDVFDNSLSATTIAFSDNLSEDALATGPTLYTTGGVYPNVMPASSRYPHQHSGSLFLGGTDDDSIWISKPLVIGKPPEFADRLVVAPFDGGRVTGLASLDAALVVFKESSVWLILGQPPAATGAGGSLSLPQRLQTDVGCIDHRSIVSTPEGVQFLSRSGIMLLRRDLGVVAIGKQVERTLADRPIIAASLIASYNTVRHLLGGTGDGYGAASLDYDYLHGAGEQPCWGVQRWTDPESGPSGSSVTPAVGAAVLDGTWHWLTSTGMLYRETSARGDDTAAVSGSVLRVNMLLETAPIVTSGLCGYQDVIRLHVLGEQACAPASLGDLRVSFRFDDVATPVPASAGPMPLPETDGAVVERQLVIEKPQKCRSVAIILEETVDDLGAGTAFGTIVTGIAVQLAPAIDGLHPLPASQKG